MPATPPEYVNWPPFARSWSTRTSNLGWLVPRFANAAPNGPAPSSGYVAPPTIRPGTRGSSVTGTWPGGAGERVGLEVAGADAVGEGVARRPRDRRVGPEHRSRPLPDGRAGVPVDPAAAHAHRRAHRVARRPGDDVDGAGHRVRPPGRRRRPADDLDLLDVALVGRAACPRARGRRSRGRCCGRPSARAASWRWGPVDCRLVTWTSRAESWMTLTPGTERRASPTLVLAVVSRVAAGTTDVVTGASTTRTSVREAVTTTVSPKLAMASTRGGASTKLVRDGDSLHGPVREARQPGRQRVGAGGQGGELVLSVAVRLRDARLARTAERDRRARQHGPRLVDDAAGDAAVLRRRRDRRQAPTRTGRVRTHVTSHACLQRVSGEPCPSSLDSHAFPGRVGGGAAPRCRAPGRQPPGWPRLTPGRTSRSPRSLARSSWHYPLPPGALPTLQESSAFHGADAQPS